MAVGRWSCLRSLHRALFGAGRSFFLVEMVLDVEPEPAGSLEGLLVLLCCCSISMLDARCSIVGCMHMYLCGFTFCLVAPSFLLSLPSSPLLVACVGHHSCLVRARFLHIILCLPSPSTSLHFAPLFFPVTRPRPLSSSFARAFSPDSDSDPDLDSDLPSALPTPDRALA